MEIQDYNKYIEREAQILNELCPMVAMIKSMADNSAHYDKNTVVAARTGATLDDYITRLYNTVKALEAAHGEISKKTVLK